MEIDEDAERNCSGTVVLRMYLGMYVDWKPLDRI
jgi:hypothetical protein